MGTRSFLQWLLWLVMPTRLSIGGGGDGGGDAAAVRQRELERDYEIARDKAKINSLFGITDYNYGAVSEVPSYTATPYSGGRQKVDDARSQYTSEIQRLTDLITGNEAAYTAAGQEIPGVSDEGIFIPPLGEEENAWGIPRSRDRNALPSYTEQYSIAPGAFSDGGPKTYQVDIRDKLSRYEKELAGLEEEYPTYDATELSDKASESATTRESTLEGIYQDIMGKSMYELDTQFDRKKADVLAMLADRGLSRSTVGQTTFDRMDEIYDTQEAGFEQTADAARESIRKADQDTRTNLIQMIDAGGDYGNARATALAGLDSNIQQGTNMGRAQDLTNLFSAMNELYGQKQYVDAYNEGTKYGSSNLVTPGTGTTTTGSVLNY